MTDAAQDRFKWRFVVICGLLWGVVVTMAVTLSQPIGDLRFVDLVSWTSAVTLQMGLCGLIWASGCKLSEDFRRPLSLFFPTLLCAWLLHMALVLSPLGVLDRAPGNFDTLSAKLPLLDLASYSLWVNLFYGGLYALGYGSTRTTLRLRRRLADLRAVRSEAEASLREARLSAVRGQMQPAMLLEALDALRRTFIERPATSDRLFDLLISFLRAAMPGLRSGTSTLSAELSLIKRYAKLRDELKTGPPTWRLDLDEPPVDLAFPPLRLLPALDRLSRAAPAGSAVEVTAAEKGVIFLVQIAIPPARAATTAVLPGLRSTMQRDLGAGASDLAGLAGVLVGELRLPSAPVHPPSLEGVRV